jgi:adenine-specific DNA-methyltransferase
MVVAQVVEINREQRINKSSTHHKAIFGQYLTPYSIASFMADLCIRYGNIKQKINILDPGAGQGILAVSLIEKLRTIEEDISIYLDAYEIDDTILPDLSHHLEALSYKYNITYKVIKDDFIESTTQELGWKINKSYTHIIMNPPYRKMNVNSSSHKHLKDLGIDTVNFYSAFVALGIELLEEDGVLVAIIPRSFCNGKYFLPFRKQILGSTEIVHIHSFLSRTESFREENVLQENLIIVLKKVTRKNKLITISTSEDRELTGYIETNYKISEIINPEDKEQYINIPQNRQNKNFQLTSTLQDLNINISTGPIVDFRMREKLIETPNSESIPLVYSVHLKSNHVIWPIISKKPNAIKLDENEKKKNIFRSGYYVIVKRFSSKEERRRIWPTLITSSDFNGLDFTVENHLNIIHCNKTGLEKSIAIGLFVFLNTNYIDQVFRQFSGHTQVNATDLKNIKYPSLAQLTMMSNIYLSNKYHDFDLILEMAVRNV